MVTKILECNVDDISKGGVYSLVNNVIQHNLDNKRTIDIASIAEFEDKNDIDELNKKNCSVFFVGSKRSKILRFYNIYKKTRALIINEKYDYVHIHSDTSYIVLPFLLAAKNSKVKKVIIHSHAAGLDGSHRKIKLFLHKLFKNYISKSTAELVACSDVAGKWMFSASVQDKVKIINNGIDLRKFKYNPEIRSKVRTKLNLENKLVVGNVGRLAFQKNHIFLIKVFKKLVETNPNAILLLVGEGPLKNELKGLVKNNNLANNVIFYGTSNHVENLLQAMDVFALPSHFEGLPIAAVEAQAAGLPTIFSKEISASAGLINNSIFLPINDSKKDINNWVETIISYSKRPHVETEEELKREGYSIDQTVSSFFDLYR